MKRVLIAVLALIGFSAASFAQSTAPVKKNEPSNHVAKKAPDKKQGKVEQDKNAKATAPVAKTPTTTKPTTTAKTNSNASHKNSGTPDKSHVASTGSTKTNGKADTHHKTNKKHA